MNPSRWIRHPTALPNLDPIDQNYPQMDPSRSIRESRKCSALRGTISVPLRAGEFAGRWAICRSTFDFAKRKTRLRHHDADVSFSLEVLQARRARSARPRLPGVAFEYSHILSQLQISWRVASERASQPASQALRKHPTRASSAPHFESTPDRSRFKMKG